MVSRPKRGQRVIVRYKKSLKAWFPLEGQIGTVEIVCLAQRCRNHGILIQGKLYAIPCGNLFYYDQ